LEGQARVIRVNALSREGRPAAMLYAIRAVPTLVIVDGCGTETGRFVGLFGAKAVVEQVRKLPACMPEQPTEG